MHRVQQQYARRGTALACALVGLMGLGCTTRSAVAAEADDEVDAGMPCGFGPPCDVTNFGGRTCEKLGLEPGTLSCDPNTCFLVLKGCGRPDGGTSGAGGTRGSTGMPNNGGTGAPAPIFQFPPFDFDGGFFGAGFFGGDGGFGFNDEDGGTDPGFFGGGFFGGQGNNNRSVGMDAGARPQQN